MKKFTIEITNEMVNYLQRLGLDIDTRLSVIDRMFVNHKDDKDASLFESIPWKKYYKELENAQNEYELAKLKFGEEVVKPAINEKLGHTVKDFTWRIDDFQSGEVQIEIFE